MWSSLPRSVRGLEGNKRVDALRRRAEQVGSSGGPGTPAAADPSRPASAEPDRADGGLDAATVIALALAGIFVVCAVIGLVTVLRWLVPG